jgi:hypothetical protein
MRLMKYFAAVAVVVAASTGTAQNIRWNPIGPNAPAPMDIHSLRPPTTTYNQVGPLTFGSDGSRGYTTGNTTIVKRLDGQDSTGFAVGPVVVMDDGSKGQWVGDTFMMFNQSGQHIANCFRSAGQVSCTRF